MAIKIEFSKKSELEGEYKEKIIDLLLMLGGKLHFYDSYFSWKNNSEFIIGLYLENPDSIDICCWSVKNKTRPGKPRTEKIKMNGGWGATLFYKNLYEHLINENEKIRKFGAWDI